MSGSAATTRTRRGRKGRIKRGRGHITALYPKNVRGPFDFSQGPLRPNRCNRRAPSRLVGFHGVQQGEGIRGVLTCLPRGDGRGEILRAAQIVIGPNGKGTRTYY